MINLVSNPTEVSEEEITILNKRREQEFYECQEIFQDVKTSPINHSKELEKLKDAKTYKELKGQNSQFYCLDIEWFLHWKAYLTNKCMNISKSKLRISQNSRIGK